MGAIAGGPLPAAQASDAGLRTTLKRDLAHIKASQLKIRAATRRMQRTHSPTALIRAIESQDRNLNALRRRVSREAPSSRAGHTAKRDVVKGLRLIVESNVMLDRDLRRAASHRTVSKRQVAEATLTDARGNRDLLIGAKLLRL